jgi:hypothetical protein
MRWRDRRFIWTLSIVGLLVLLALGWYFDWGHADVEKLPQLHGKSLAAVIAQLGQPDERSEYSLGKQLDEMRIELYNTYPPDDPKTAQTRILELQWHYWRYDIAVWLHQVNGEWRVLNTLRWQKGIVF